MAKRTATRKPGTERAAAPKKETGWLKILLILFAVAAVLAGLLYEASLLFGDVFDQYDVMQYKGRYRALAEGCGGTNATGCCLSSVDVIQSRHYNLTNDSAYPGNDGCPEGYLKEQLRCEGSYSWCEPKEQTLFG